MNQLCQTCPFTCKDKGYCTKYYNQVATINSLCNANCKDCMFTGNCNIEKARLVPEPEHY